MVQVEVIEVAKWTDGKGIYYIIFLKQFDGDRIFHLLAGLAEANTIISTLQGYKFERPLTHDLIKEIIVGLKGEVTEAIINDVNYAKLHIKFGSDETLVDARPGDAIAIALKTSAPIYVSDEMVKGLDKKSEESQEIDLKDYIAGLKPEDLGKFDI